MDVKNLGVNFVRISDGAAKSDYTKAILEALPEWFGNKEALDDYAAKVAELPYWAAFNKDNKCIRFFSVTIHYGHTGDIFVCGIHPEYHRCGASAIR